MALKINITINIENIGGFRARKGVKSRKKHSSGNVSGTEFLQKILDQFQPINLEISGVKVEIGPEEAHGPSQTGVSRASEIPDLIDSDELNFKVMKNVVTGGQIDWLVKAGYEITGHNANKLKGIIADESTANQGTGYVSLLDGRKFAEELNRQNPGEKFRIPTLAEYSKLCKVVGTKLSGKDFWIWTESRDDNGDFLLRRQGCQPLDSNKPDVRLDHTAVRLISDKKKG